MRKNDTVDIGKFCQLTNGVELAANFLETGKAGKKLPLTQTTYSICVGVQTKVHTFYCDLSNGFYSKFEYSDLTELHRKCTYILISFFSNQLSTSSFVHVLYDGATITLLAWWSDSGSPTAVTNALPNYEEEVKIYEKSKTYIYIFMKFPQLFILKWPKNEMKPEW